MQAEIDIPSNSVPNGLGVYTTPLVLSHGSESESLVPHQVGWMDGATED